MKIKTKNYTIWALAVVIILAGGSFFIPKKNTAPNGKLDAFAQCLKDKGANFYGASWCSHCNNQKKLFGSSQKFLPYIECSTPDGKGQTQICIDKKIEGYPTWIFADGSTQSGELSFEILAQKTGCALPQ